MRQLAAAGADLATANAAGWRPLHEAANASQPSAVSALLELGAPANAADPDGTTALHLAAMRVGAGKICIHVHIYTYIYTYTHIYI